MAKKRVERPHSNVYTLMMVLTFIFGGGMSWLMWYHLQEEYDFYNPNVESITTIQDTENWEPKEIIANISAGGEGEAVAPEEGAEEETLPSVEEQPEAPENPEGNGADKPEKPAEGNG